MKRLRIVLCVALTLAAASPLVAAEAGGDDETNPHVWESNVTSVAVFKNGLGFFLREGETGLRDGWCMSKHIPPAAFGTLAIYSHQEDQAVDVVGSGPGEVVVFDGVDAPDTLEARRERLEASMHLKLQINYTYKGNDAQAAGTLRSVGPQYAILEAAASTFAVPVKGIERIQILELPIRVHVAADEGPAPEKTKLGMAYLRKGITWIPEYTLRIIDEETAELTLRGTLVNEAEDLVHADVHLVVGVPHFVHTDYMAPIAVGQVIRTIGAAVAPGQVQTQIMNRAAIASNADSRPFNVVTQNVDRGPGDLSSAVGNLPQMGGAAATDYTVYTKKDLTVRRGEKAIVTLFTKKIAFGHIYRWTVGQRMNHHLVLENATDTAWTTGPCLAVSDRRPLSEDLLKYTPEGAAGELPVTAAINIARDHTETEIARKLKAHQPRHNYYLDLVTLKGEVKLRNFEKRDVKVVVTAPVPGLPTEVKDDGKVTVNTSNLKLTERSATIRWSVTLEPDETRTLEYTYERYVPSS